MNFTATQVDKLRVRFAEYRDKHKVRPKELLSIELVLDEMDECPAVPRAFFEGRQRKALNNKLWRFACGTRSEDETLTAIQLFLSHEEAVAEAPPEDDEEMRIVHGFMANGSIQARRVFEAIHDGLYVARWFRDSEERIELNFLCDREEMIIQVEEHVYVNDRRDEPDGRWTQRGMGKAVRKGYGFLSTGKYLLHIFLVGAHARDRVHYLENGKLLSDGHPYLVRVGGGEPGDQRHGPVGGEEAIFFFDVLHFKSRALEEQQQKERAARTKSPPGADPMRFHGPPAGVAWGVLPNVVRDAPGALERALIEAVRRNSSVDVRRALDKNADPNFQDDEGMTCLHHAAALGARTALRMLVATGKCNYLIPDHRGRYPSDLAIEWSRDFAVARLLTKKRLEQAHAEGVASRRSWRVR